MALLIAAPVLRDLGKDDISDIREISHQDLVPGQDYYWAEDMIVIGIYPEETGDAYRYASVLIRNSEGDFWLACMKLESSSDVCQEIVERSENSQPWYFDRMLLSSYVQVHFYPDEVDLDWMETMVAYQNQVGGILPSSDYQDGFVCLAYICGEDQNPNGLDGIATAMTVAGGIALASGLAVFAFGFFQKRKQNRKTTK